MPPGVILPGPGIPLRNDPEPRKTRKAFFDAYQPQDATARR